MIKINTTRYPPDDAEQGRPHSHGLELPPQKRWPVSINNRINGIFCCQVCLTLTIVTNMAGVTTRSNEGCGGEGGGGGGGGCDLEWCEYTPALTEFQVRIFFSQFLFSFEQIQFYLGYVIASISFPFCVGICPALFSKVVSSWGNQARLYQPLAWPFHERDNETI